MTTAAQLYAGVDISKDHLDVCLRWSEPESHDEAFFVTHDDAGIDTRYESICPAQCPALCVALCRAFFGGSTANVPANPAYLPSAALNTTDVALLLVPAGE